MARPLIVNASVNDTHFDSLEKFKGSLIKIISYLSLLKRTAISTDNKHTFKSGDKVGESRGNKYLSGLGLMWKMIVLDTCGCVQLCFEFHGCDNINKKILW